MVERPAGEPISAPYEPGRTESRPIRKVRRAYAGDCGHADAGCADSGADHSGACAPLPWQGSCWPFFGVRGLWGGPAPFARRPVCGS